MSSLNYNALKSFDGVVSEMDFNRLVDVVQRNELSPGANYTILVTPGGTVIRPAGKAAAVGASEVCPFTVSLAAGESEGDLVLTVSPGTINELLPTNIFDEFAITDSDFYFVKANVTTDGQKVTSSVLVVDADEPTAQEPAPQALPAVVQICLAVVSGGKVYRTKGCGSLTLTGRVQFTTDKPSPPAPGELNHLDWYVWDVSAA